MKLQKLYQLLKKSGYISISYLQVLEALSQEKDTISSITEHVGFNDSGSVRLVLKCLEKDKAIETRPIKGKQIRTYHLTNNGKVMADALNPKKDDGALLVLKHLKAICGDPDNRLPLDDFLAKVGKDYRELNKLRKQNLVSP